MTAGGANRAGSGAGGPAADVPRVLLLTRPLARSRAFAEAVATRLGAEVETIIAPLVEIVCAGDIPDLGRYAGVIFTSASALECLPPGFDGGGRPAYCVGDRTAEAARRAGFEAVSADGDATALVRLVRRLDPSGPLIHLRGAHAAADLADELREAGYAADERIVYRQQDLPPDPAALELLAAPRDVVAPAFSPRGARRLVQLAAGRRARLHLVAISAAAVRACAPPPNALTVAERPTGEAMVEAVVAALGPGRLVDTGPER